MAATLFGSRGFSGRTVDALVNAGIPAPEWLLFSKLDEIERIPGIGKASMRQIVDYRRKWIKPPPECPLSRVILECALIGTQTKG